jgi:hypothetical protein
MDLPRLSRRTLIAGTTVIATLAAAAFAAKSGLVSRSTSLARAIAGGRLRSISLPTAEMEDWMAAVGAEFDIAYTRMRLAGVRALDGSGDRPAGLRRRGFVAVFELPQGESLPGELVYRIAHRSYGAFDIYLSQPADTRLNQMIAVFN